MSSAIAADPLKKSWKLGDYAACVALMSSGAKPRPSTLRHILAPRQLLISKHTLWLRAREAGRGPSPQESFHEALLMLIENIPSLERENKAIYGQIKDSHLHFLTFFTVSEMIRSGGSPLNDARLDKAISILAAISPSCLAAKSYSPRFGANEDNVQCFFQGRNRDENLWSEACRMPAHSAKMFLDASLRALERGADNKAIRLDAHAHEAWHRLLKSEHAPLRLERRAESIRLQARVATARHRNAAIDGIQQLSTKMLREAAASGDRSIATSIMNEGFSVLRIVCQRHPFSDDPLPSSALLGERVSRLVSMQRFSTPTKFSKSNDAQEMVRAQIFLDWLDACAALAAEFSLAPMSNNGTKNLSEAYLSLRTSGMDFPHAFPTAAPSLDEAFDSRVLALALALADASFAGASKRAARL